LKENEDGTVRLLLTFDQMWKLFPDTSVYCIPDPDTYIICDKYEVECSNVIRLAVPPLLANLLKLCTQSKVLQTVSSQEYITFTSQHPLKSSSVDIPIIVAPIFIYSDDTSGNRSKKWNKFDLWCVSLACLPRNTAQELSNIFLVCCSNRTNAIQMTGPIVDNLLTLEKGIRVYDSPLKTDVLVIAPVICLLCDNARVSELLNHLGSTAVRLCRICSTSDGNVLGEVRSKE
jgi:hypothetical protein